MNKKYGTGLFGDFAVLWSKTIVAAFPAVRLLRILDLVPCITFAADIDVLEQALFCDVEFFCHDDNLV